MRTSHASQVSRISHAQRVHHPNWLFRLLAHMLHPLRRKPPAALTAKLAQQRARLLTQEQAEAVTWRWMAGRATWQEAQQAQQMQLSGWPYTQAPHADGLPDIAGTENPAADAMQLADRYGVVAQEIDRRRAPSASGDHLYIAVVSGLPGIPHTRSAAAVSRGPDAANYAPGSKWMVRIRRRHPEQISCTCGGMLPQGAGCGHIGAVLLLRR